MKKKLAALAMTTVMVLSLVGCGKKIEGTYTAEVDLTDALEERLNDYIKKNHGCDDFDWNGSISLSMELELSDGEYTFKADKEQLEKDYKEFMCENLETFILSLIEDNLYDTMTVDEFIESSGYSSIWEMLGYDSVEDYYDAYFDEGSIADTTQKESGDYEIDGDEITLEDFAGDDMTFTFEDGELKGKLDFSDLGMDDNVKVTFEREDD